MLVTNIGRTVASLPPASSNQGGVFVVDDSLLSEAVASGSIVAGGGATRVRVRSDGTNWRIYGRIHKGADGAGASSAAGSWASAVIANGGTVSAGKLNAITKFISDLQAAGVYQRLDRLWVFAAENTQQALTDLIAAAQATPVNAPVFTASRGYKGDGVSAYLDSGFRWDTAGGNFQQNDCAMGVWVDLVQSPGTTCLIGHENGSYSQLYHTTTTRSAGLTGSGNVGPYTAANSLGFYHAQRTGAAAQAAYGAGGVLEASGTQASANVGHRNQFILANNYPNTAIQFCASRVGAAWIGASLTQAQITAFAQSLETLITNSIATTTTFDFTPGTMPSGAALTRASTGWYFNSVNGIRNTTFAGAVAGSPGTLPNNWFIAGSVAGLTQTIALGTEAGIPYIDITYAGTPTATSAAIEFEQRNIIPATMGQKATASAYLRLSAGDWTNISGPNWRLDGWTSGGSNSETFILNYTPTSAALNTQLVNQGGVFAQPTTAFMSCRFFWGMTVGNPVNFSIRIGGIAATTVNLTSAANDVPRFTYEDPPGSTPPALLGLLNEPAQTNWVNSSMAGAVNGVYQSGGALPTGWSFNVPLGITITIVGTGTIDGMTYIDIRYNGTSGDIGGANQYLCGSGQNPVVQGDMLSNSVFMAVVAGSLANVTYFQLLFTQRNAGGGGVGNIFGPQFTPDGTLRRYSWLSSAYAPDVSVVNNAFLMRWTSGAAIDFTIRIAQANSAKLNGVYSPIINGYPSGTRAADFLNLTLPTGQYTMDVERVSGHTIYNAQNVGGTWTVPNDASPVRKVTAFQTGQSTVLPNAETTYYVQTVVNNGGTVSAARQALIDNMISSLKSTGLWNSLDRLWMLAAENAPSALTDIRIAALATAVNAPAFTANQGYTFDGATNYIDTKFIASQSAVAMTGTSMRLAVYERINFGGTARAAGCQNTGTQSIGVVPRTGSSVAQGTMNSVANYVSNIYDSTGLTVVSLSGSTAPLYKNGQMLETQTVSAGTVLPTLSNYIGCWNAAGTPASFRPSMEGCVAFGSNLTSAQEAQFYNIIVTYLAALNNIAATTNFEATAWALSTVVAGGTVSAGRLAVVDTLITNLKNSGAWSNLDRLWLLACENATSACTDLMTGARAVPVNSPTFTADRGYQGDGATSYINTGFNWQALASKFQATSACMGVWMETVVASAGSTCVIGHENGGYSQLYVTNSATFRFYAVMANGGNAPSFPGTTGFYHAQRGDASYQSEYGNNGGALDNTDAHPVNATLGNRNIFVLANNYPGPVSPLLPSPSRVAAAWIGCSMTDSQIKSFYSALRTYMTAVGVA